MWKQLSSKEIFNHPRLTLIEDEVLLPNGEKTTYLKYKLTGACATLLAKNKEGKFLVQKEYDYPIDTKILQFPGGYTSADEKVEDGANRELIEEGKLKANKLEELGYYLMDSRRSDIMMHVFLATDLEECHMESSDQEEEFENFWFSEEEIDQLIKENKIINLHTLASWAIYKSHKK